MPIVANRTGPLEIRQTNPLTPQQKQQLWEAIVNNWVDKNPDKFRAMLEPNGKQPETYAIT